MNSTFDIGVLNNSFFIHIPAYSLFTCIGLLCVMLYTYNSLEIKTEKEFRSFLILILMLCCGVGLGSKLLFILTKIPEVLYDFSWRKLLSIIITAGFVFYGGLFGAFGAAYYYARIFKMDYSDLLYRIVPSFPLFHSWGRIGCLFGGCCYGKVIDHGFYHLEDEPEIIRIPTQLYESMYLMVLFLGLLFLKKRRIKDGRILTFIYLLAYGLFRFAIEFFRGDDIRGIWFGLSTSQWISLVTIVLSLVVLTKAHMESKTITNVS